MSNEPRNELEKHLAAANAGQLSSDELLQTLLTMQVFMPVQDEKPMALNIQRSNRAQPLVLADDDGTPILVLFSSPERSHEFLKDFPDFKGGLLEPFKWVIEKMGTGYGIALNPGSELGFDMDPETVAELTEMLASPGKKPN